ncbi:winged helix-turn-helix transcriptional regulator [Pseudomonas synxantha]|uniref:winged helix-turn-helix transcriptional regulator n=1 Tax=Pseudomonas synxantha TaxID=47883 RepID=UPI001E50996A|nr:hypothetical protein [Pseudomonas synxantha]
MQRNGRLKNLELPKEVGVSPSPCLRRFWVDHVLRFSTLTEPVLLPCEESLTVAKGGSFLSKSLSGAPTTVGPVRMSPRHSAEFQLLRETV